LSPRPPFYRKRGFVKGEAFGGYKATAFNQILPSGPDSLQQSGQLVKKRTRDRRDACSLPSTPRKMGGMRHADWLRLVQRKRSFSVDGDATARERSMRSFIIGALLVAVGVLGYLYWDSEHNTIFKAPGVEIKKN
jgi:hypothetical protein